MKLFFITGNAKKFAEVEQLVPGVQQLDIDLPEIQDMDPKKIVAAKLKEARKHHNGIIAVEDVSLSLDGCKGLPGPMIKWWLETLGVQGIFDLVQKLGNDRASIGCHIGLSQSGQEIKYFSAQCRGRIVAPRLTSPFGWNPIFEQDGLKKTYAEMTDDERKTLSHRALAWGQVRKFLETMI